MYIVHPWILLQKQVKVGNIFCIKRLLLLLIFLLMIKIHVLLSWVFRKYFLLPAKKVHDNSARKYFFCKYSCKSSFEEEKTQKQIYLLISLFIKQKYNNFSNVIEFISKTVIGQYNLRTIFLHSHWRK